MSRSPVIHTMLVFLEGLSLAGRVAHPLSRRTGGWDVTYSKSDNSISTAPSQADQYDAAYEECAAPLRGERRDIASDTK